MSLLAEMHAMCDVLDQISINSEALSVEEALEVREGLTLLKQSVYQLNRKIEEQIKDRLEDQPKQVGDLVYKSVPKRKRRTDHDVVKNLISDLAQVDPETGEILRTLEAVRRAIDLVYKAFVAPADLPKTKFLRGIGKSIEEVSTWEETGRDLSVEQADEDETDEDEKPADEDEKPEDDE